MGKLTKEEIILLYLQDPKEVKRKIYSGDISSSLEDLTILCELGDPEVLTTYFLTYVRKYNELPKELEKAIKSIFCKLADCAYWFSFLGYIGGDDEEVLNIICQDAKTAYYYARNILQEPSDATRTAVCKNPERAYRYAKFIDNKPTDETRLAACKDPMWAYRYARNVDEKPSSYTRNAVCQDPEWAYNYACDVDKKPHPETWAAAKQDPKWKEKYELFRMTFLNNVGRLGVYRDDV